MERELTYDDIIRIVQLIEAAGCELHLKYHGLTLDVIPTRPSEVEDRVTLAGDQNPVKAPAVSALPSVAESAVPAVSAPSPVVGENLVAVTAPMVGMFYRCPHPGADPFVQVGEHVEAGATLCIIEVMKLMNSVTAPVSGVVVKIAVEDGQPVEYGQLLMEIMPE